MRNRNEMSATISANVEVFDYLKEKVGDRKTKTEAYCDLLDKSLAGFVSPFLRKQDYDLQPCQCHVTVSGLASEWHWHRATVRSFLETLETFGQLQRTKLAKSVIITMPLQTANVSAERIGQEEPGFAMSLQEVLSDWVIGKRSSADVGKSCGQLFRRTLAEMTERDNRSYPDNGSGTASANIIRQEDTLRETILGCITYAALQRVLRKSRFDDSTPLIQFFRLDLGEEWGAFIEVSKELADLILNEKSDETDFDTDEDTERLKSLRSPFISLLAKVQEGD